MDSKKKQNKTRCRTCPYATFCSNTCYNRDVPDASCAHAVKYDKLNKRIAILEGKLKAANKENKENKKCVQNEM
jgi:sulfatase maturation enzyme AslB (radical SAM superfamily)